MKKKIISLLLVIVMIIGMMPAALASDCPFTVTYNGEVLELEYAEEYDPALDEYGLSVYQVVVPSDAETVAIEGDCVLAVSSWNDSAAGYQREMVPVVGAGDYIIIIDMEVMGPRYALAFIVEGGGEETPEEPTCTHSKTTTNYGKVNNSETHTVTVTCECGATISGPTTEPCVDEGKDGACDKCGDTVAVVCEHADVNWDGTCDLCKEAYENPPITADQHVNIQIGNELANPNVGSIIEVPVYVSYNYSGRIGNDTGYFCVQVDQNELTLDGVSKDGNQHFAALSSISETDQGNGVYKISYWFKQEKPGTSDFKLLCTLRLKINGAVEAGNIFAINAVNDAKVSLSMMASLDSSSTYTLQSGSITFVNGCIHKGTETHPEYEQVSGTETHYVDTICSCGERINRTTADCVDAAEGETNDGKCNICGGDMKVPVTGITLDKTELPVEEGDNPVTLTATVEPANASNHGVNWSSDNADVATVADGVVTFAGPGSATITATTVDGGFKATCAVTVQSLNCIALNAPVLDADKAVRGLDYIVLAAPAVSEQDFKAAVEYSMHNGVGWQEWQSNPRFDNLAQNVTYKFRARYVADNTLIYANSEASGEITLRVRDELDVSFRLIGSSLPTERIFFQGTGKMGNYYGAEYQTWLKTTPKTLTETTTAAALAEAMLTEAGIAHTLAGGGDTVITAPEYFGGYALSKASSAIGGNGASSYSLWYITILRGEEVLEVAPNSDTVLEHGDQVILHFAWQENYERVHGPLAEDAYRQNYLKVPDLSVADWQQIDAVEANIAALELSLNEEDTSAAEAARAAYDAMSELQKEQVDLKVYEYLLYIEESIALLRKGEKVELNAPVLSATAAEVTANSITLTIPAASAQDANASIEYAIKPDGGEWGEWTAAPVFTGLNAKTTYYFKARFVAAEEHEVYKTSKDCDPVSIRTTTGEYITFRVIGGTIPSTKVGNLTSDDAYNGAVYQNWLKTVKAELPENVKSRDMALTLLEEYGITNNAKTHNTTFSVTAPEEFGGHELSSSSAKNSSGEDASWYITIIRGTEVIEKAMSTSYAKDTLQDGDQVILHFVYKANYELKSGKKAGESNYVQQYLKVRDLTKAENEACDTVIALINAIGEVTAESGAAIKAARDAYDAQPADVQGYVANYETLTIAEKTFEDLESIPVLRSPVLTEAAAVGTTITVTAPAASEDDTAATVQYRVSADGTHWTEWQNENVFKFLDSATTYSIQARYVTSNVESFRSSQPGEAITATTAAAQTIEVDTYVKWKNAVVGAPQDSTELIIYIKSDIEISKEGYFAVEMPTGTNITMVGAGGILIGTRGDDGGSQAGEGIWVGRECKLTLKDITYHAIGRLNGYGTMDDKSFGSMLKFTSYGAEVHLVNVTMYGDSTLVGNKARDVQVEAADNNNNTVNIYSGAYVNIKDEYFIKDSKTTINLIPTGDIILEGDLDDVKTNLIAQDGKPVKGGSILAADGTYTEIPTEQIAAGVIDTTDGYGIRIITSDDGAVIPTKLDAPVITMKDIIIGVGEVTVPYIESPQDPKAEMQIRVYTDYSGLKYSKWITRPVSFTLELLENVDYRLEVRYKTIGGNWSDSDITSFNIVTDYEDTPLAAPTLGDPAAITENSVTLKAVADCPETRANAVAEYRMSTDGSTWGDWNTELTFSGLEPGTYYFQARYKSGKAPWVDSEPGNVLEVNVKAEVVVDYGDLNGDEVINDTDASLLRQYLAGKTVEIDAAAADVNTDGEINLTDLIILRRYIADLHGFGTLPYTPAA